MKQVALQLVLAAFGAVAIAAPDLECKAIYRTVDANDRLVEKVVQMPVVEQFTGYKRYSADHEGRHYTVGNEGETALVQIVKPPHYTHGLVMRAAPDAQGRLNLAEVEGRTVYKIECNRK